MIFRFGITIRDVSGCSSVVQNNSMVRTCPATPAISIHSPTLNGLVKMMVRPAKRLPSTPCSARPTPTPATLTPAIKAVIFRPAVSSATTSASAKISRRTIRTSSSRIGGSIVRRSSHRSISRPIQRAAISPMTITTTAEISAPLCSIV